jgi:glycerophosphoryl diester phosphodiesterase
MAADPKGGEKSLQAGGLVYRRIGHKGADAITAGNTLDSFEVAVEHGVDMIELDVLRDREGRLIVAHDPEDALRRRPLELTEALDAFTEEPLDKVEIDCDLKLHGREAELAGAIAGRGLTERTMVSTMEIGSIRKLRQIEPELRLGWTYPKTKRDWTQYRWAAPALAAGLGAMKRRFPALLAQQVPELDVDAVWAYHRIITPKLVEAALDTGVELIAWTVDDPIRIAELLEMGVNGICTNDPRLFDAAERGGPPPSSADEEPSPEEPRRRRFLRRGKKDQPKDADAGEVEAEQKGPATAQRKAKAKPAKKADAASEKKA